MLNTGRARAQDEFAAMQPKRVPDLKLMVPEKWRMSPVTAITGPTTDDRASSGIGQIEIEMEEMAE